MPKVGEAYYELTARDQALLQSLGRAEGRITSAGRTAESAFGTRVSGAFGATGTAVTNLGKQVTDLEGRTSRFGGVFRNLGQGILQGVGIAAFMGVGQAVGAVVGGIGRAIDAASNMNETVSKVGVVFGQEAPKILEWGNSAATAMGQSKQAALEAAGTLGNLFVSLGLARDRAGDMSTSLVQLAGDLASFNNTDPTEALEALRAGLVGETEPLRRFGVNMNEATLTAKALELGLISNTKNALDPAVRAQAAYALILDQTKTAQGDFARTSEGLANQQRIAAAKVEDAFAKLGEKLLPLAAVVVPALADAFIAVLGPVGAVLDFLKQMIDVVKPIADVISFMVGHPLLLLGPLFFGAAIAGQAAAGALREFSLAALTGAVSSTTLGLAVRFLLGPVGIAMMLLEAFALAVQFNFLGIGDLVKGVVDGIVGFVKQFISVLLDLAITATSVAAAIPGPWQQAAGDLSRTLAGMKADVQAWGTDTKKTVDDTADGLHYKLADTGQKLPGEVAGPLATGASTVAAGAKTGITDPIVTAATNARTGAVAEAKKTPSEVASSLREGRTEITDAGTFLNDAFKQGIAPAKEIAYLEGQLAGNKLGDGLISTNAKTQAAAQAQYDALVKEMLDPDTKPSRVAEIEAYLTAANLERGLVSKNPEIRAAAEAYKSMVEERLWALRNGVPEFARQTGQSYADALGAKKAEIERQTGLWGQAVKLNLDPSSTQSVFYHAYSWGYRTGTSWGNGITNGLQATYGSTYAALNRFSTLLHAQSPPGPESPLHEIDVWGRRTMQAWGEAMAAEGEAQVKRVGSFVMAGSEALRMAEGLARVMVTTPSGREISVAPAAAAHAAAFNGGISVGDVNVNVNVEKLVADDVGQVRDLSRAIGNEVRLSITRTPASFNMPTG